MDEKLLDDYLKCKSVNNAINKLIDVLKVVDIVIKISNNTF
jgi:hypothetical protein